MEAFAEKRFFLEIDESETEFPSLNAMKTSALEAKSRGSGSLCAWVDHGPNPWWMRLFGARRDAESFFSLRWCGSHARLIFLDDNHSEYRAIDEKYPIPLDEPLSEAMMSEDPQPREEFMRKDRSFLAITEFLESGVRPAWLRYRFVE
ncbi:MAG: hypothetical protein KA144_03725 [Xanthomonadaceae bacterium]|nr:hypothetical protein [Xanthomonadaceae bacterium]